MTEIRINGVVIPNSIVVVDTSVGKVELGTPDSPWQVFDMDNVCVEVNMFTSEIGL